MITSRHQLFKHRTKTAESVSPATGQHTSKRVSPATGQQGVQSSLRRFDPNAYASRPHRLPAVGPASVPGLCQWSSEATAGGGRRRCRGRRRPATHAAALAKHLEGLTLDGSLLNQGTAVFLYGTGYCGVLYSSTVPEMKRKGNAWPSCRDTTADTDAKIKQLSTAALQMSFKSSRRHGWIMDRYMMY